MKLREYLTENNLTITDFAKKIGYSRVHVCGLITGNRKLTDKFKRVINLETKGTVTDFTPSHERLHFIRSESCR